MKKQILYSFILFFFVASNLLAQEVTMKALSLDQALQLAYWNNPDMLEARKEIEASKGRRFDAEMLPGPEVEIEGSESLTLKQPLDVPGTRFLRGQVAKSGTKIAKNDLNLMWAKVRQDVMSLYNSILAAEKAEEIAQNNLDLTRQFFTRVETRFQSGSAIQSDVLRAKIEVSKAENELLVIQKDRKVSIGKFNLALGIPVENQTELSDSLSYEALSYNYDQIRNMALQSRADILSEAEKLNITKKIHTSSILKTLLPEPIIGLKRNKNEESSSDESGEPITTSNNETIFYFEAKYPLWGFNLGQVKEAKANKEKQEIHLETLKKKVSLEAYETFLEVELAGKQVAIQKKALDEASELLRQITLRYEEGETSFLTYLENLKTIKETRLNYFNALKNYKEKVAELERVIQVAPIPQGAKS